MLDIRKQKLTQVFFLPKYGDILDDSLIYFDRIFSIENEFVD